MSRLLLAHVLAAALHAVHATAVSDQQRRQQQRRRSQQRSPQRRRHARMFQPSFVQMRPVLPHNQSKSGKSLVFDELYCNFNNHQDRVVLVNLVKSFVSFVSAPFQALAVSKRSDLVALPCAVGLESGTKRCGFACGDVEERSSRWALKVVARLTLVRLGLGAKRIAVLHSGAIRLCDGANNVCQLAVVELDGIRRTRSDLGDVGAALVSVDHHSKPIKTPATVKKTGQNNPFSTKQTSCKRSSQAC